MKADFRISQRSNISSKVSANSISHMSRAQDKAITKLRVESVNENWNDMLKARLAGGDGCQSTLGISIATRPRIISHQV